MTHYFETPDGVGKLLATEVRHGRTYAHIEGMGFQGWYPSSILAALEDHSKELLADLPDEGVDLPYDPSPRFTDFDTTTIEPIHKLPENLDTTVRSTDGIKNYPDPMEPFPGDPHKYTTPYRSALFSLADTVDPESSANSGSYEAPRHEDTHDYVGDPYDPNIFNHDFIGEATEPTTEEWGTPASMTWDDQNNIVSNFRTIRGKNKIHFANDSNNPYENRVFADDEESAFEGHQAGEGFENPEDFDFKLSKKSDFSEVEDQNWDCLPDSNTLNNPFDVTQDRFERKSIDGEDTGAEVNPKESAFDFLSSLKYSIISEENGKYTVKSHDGSKDLGAYDTKGEAVKRLREVEYFKHHDSSTRESNKYIKHRGDKWDIIQKGTGDTLSHHDSEEEAEAAFRAMEMNKHGSIKETPQGFFITLPGGQKSGPYPTKAAAEGEEESELERVKQEKEEKEEQAKRKEEERQEKKGVVQETPEGFFATGPGGQKKGPFPTRPAAEQEEAAMKTADAGTLTYNPYGGWPKNDQDRPSWPKVDSDRPSWPKTDEDKIHWPEYDTFSHDWGKQQPTHEKWPAHDQDIHWPTHDLDHKPTLEDIWPSSETNQHHLEQQRKDLPWQWYQYLSFLTKDAEAREAAWSDVRSKALRLRREGAVEVLAFNPYEIKTRVKGDTGIYGTVVVRKNAWGQGITWYDCTCPWGQWAYRRQRSYVGRLCSHALASYYEMQSLHNTKRPIEGSHYSNGTYYDIGDPVCVTEHSTVNIVSSKSYSDVFPGDTGVITSVYPEAKYAEVRMDHLGDHDLAIPLDLLEKTGFINRSEVETNDDSSHNPTDAGTFTLDVPDVIEGYESEADQALDSPTTVASYSSSNDEEDSYHLHHDPDNDGKLEIYSDPDKPSPHDRLRTLTHWHSADVMGDDEEDNASTDTENGVADNNGGSSDMGQVVNAHHQALAWLRDDSSYDEGFDPETVRKISKNSAKNYSLREQFDLIQEAGMAEEVDYLNLKDSFYENS